MALAEDGSTEVDVAGKTVAFPRYRHSTGATMSEEQRAAEAAAFSAVDRLLGQRGPGPREPGDDDDAVTDHRAPGVRAEESDYKAEVAAFLERIRVRKADGGEG